jgi:hypothetical protein
VCYLTRVGYVEHVNRERERVSECEYVCYLAGSGYVENVNRERESASLCATLQVLDMWRMFPDRE